MKLVTPALGGGHGSKFSRKMKEAIAALLTEATVVVEKSEGK